MKKYKAHVGKFAIKFSERAILYSIIAALLGLSLTSTVLLFSNQKKLKQEMQKIEDIEVVQYIPCEGYEYISGIMPEDILEMDGVEKDLCLIAQTVWGEARGCTDVEKTQVIWCIFNRVDDPRFPDTIEGVITAKNQFYGYKPSHPVDENIYKLVVETYLRWSYEGYMVHADSGRTLDKDFIGFHDDSNGHLIFTKGC